MKFKPCPFCGSTDIVLATIPAWPTSCYELICADCNVAIHAEDTKSVCTLWNRRVEHPNPPLTLDELQEMDGEPVWVVEGKAKYYALITDIFPEAIWVISRTDSEAEMPVDEYGKTWLAYRCRPEEEHNEQNQN